VQTVTHQFAHIETLERARRWLIQAGFDPSRIEVHTQGIPRLSVTVEGGEAAEVRMIIDAAESSDPEGNPGIWDLARQRHVYPQGKKEAGTATSSESIVAGWTPQDADREVIQTDTAAELQREYREGKD
jgi:hypothetical protein